MMKSHLKVAIALIALAMLGWAGEFIFPTNGFEKTPLVIELARWIGLHGACLFSLFAGSYWLGFRFGHRFNVIDKQELVRKVQIPIFKFGVLTSIIGLVLSNGGSGIYIPIGISQYFLGLLLLVATVGIRGIYDQLPAPNPKDNGS